MNNNVLNRCKGCKDVKDLGDRYDGQFSFALHIESTVKAANRMLGFVIRQTSVFTNLKAIKSLYFTLVRSKLEFASVVWGDQPQTHLKAVEKVQNKFLRYLYYKKYHIWPDYNHVRSAHLRTEFNIPSLELRRKLAAITFLYKIINYQINSPGILSLIPFNVPPRRTRIALMFKIPAVLASTRSPLAASLRFANRLNALLNLDWTIPVKQFRKLVLQHLMNYAT